MTHDGIKISDPEFRRAVELIDAGDVDALTCLIDSSPALLSAKADGSTQEGYFANPRLIWFVAENPIRNGSLPANISDVTKALIDLGKKYQVSDLAEQLNYTIALVSSGLIARQCSLQRSLIETLVDGGADPNSGIQAALGHREIDACETLLACGADMTLELAAGLGRLADAETLVSAATKQERQRALAVAAINAQADCVALLLSNGADPDQYNPDGLHAHSTPLHQAVFAAEAKTVQTLIDHGADKTIKDKLHSCTPLQWAEHEGHAEITKLLQ